MDIKLFDSKGIPITKASIVFHCGEKEMYKFKMSLTEKRYGIHITKAIFTGLTNDSKIILKTKHKSQYATLKDVVSLKYFDNLIDNIKDEQK